MEYGDNDISQLKISDGEIIEGLMPESDASLKRKYSLKEKILETISEQEGFVDLEEVDKPVDISSSQSNTISNIDSIEYITTTKISNAEALLPNRNKTDLKSFYSSGRKAKTTDTADKNTDKSVLSNLEDNSSEIDGVQSLIDEKGQGETGIEEVSAMEGVGEEIEEISASDEIDELDTVVDDIEFLTEQIVNGVVVRYPGKIDISTIDPSIIDNNLDMEREESQENEDVEIFGVNKSEVFYNIDKQIYSSRTKSVKSIKNLRIGSGAFLPLMVALFTTIFLVVAIPGLVVFFRSNAQIKLEQNVVKDNSILAKIAKQKEEEARLAKAKIEEEKKQLDYEKGRMQATISDELNRQQMEIEAKYQKQLQDLLKSGMTKAEIDKEQKLLKEKLETELNQAKAENDKRIIEQNKLLAEKERQLQNAEDRIKKALESKEFETAQITKQLQDAVMQKDLERENISKKLQEINEFNQKVRDFHTRTYQLIASSIDDFKRGDREGAIEKLSGLIRYYSSSASFINSSDELKMKMESDIFFVNFLTQIFSESRISATKNSEILKSVSRLEQINESYREAEELFRKGSYPAASDRYQKILKEIESIGGSYSRLKEIEIITQNSQGLTIYNDALSDMRSQRYEIALKKLGDVITKTPLSDYRNQAVSNMTEIAGLISNSNTVKSQEVGAKEIFDRAERFRISGNTNEAIELYNRVIGEFPYSSFVKPSLKWTNELYGLLKNEDFKKLDKELKDKFLTDYKRFTDLRRLGDYSKAREAYYDALRNSFNIYANNSIADFKKLEDDYISSLSKETAEANKSGIEKQLVELREKITAEHKLELESKLDAQKKALDERFALLVSEKDSEIVKLKASITQMEAQYRQMLVDGGKSSQAELMKVKSEMSKEVEDRQKIIDQLKVEYEKNIVAKNDEIVKLKKSYDDLIKQKGDIEKAFNEQKIVLASVDTKNADELRKLKESHEKQVALLTKSAEDFVRKEYELKMVEINSEIAKLQSDTNIQSKQLLELYQKYNELLARYNKALAEIDESAKKNYDIAVQTAEIDAKYKKQYDDKVSMIEKEKERLKAGFDRQIDALRKELIETSTSVSLTKDEAATKADNWSNQLFARVSDVTGETVTLQFISLNHTNMVSKDDLVRAYRIDNSSSLKSEMLIATIMIISSIDSSSLYARGRIVSREPGKTVSINDLIRK